MKTRHYLSVIIIITSTVLFSCTGKKTTGESKESAMEETTDSIPAVNVYDYSVNGLPVLDDCNNPKSILTFVKVGESVTFLGKTATDTVRKKEYDKIELSDGTIGWSRSDYIIKNAVPGAVIASTPVYERPDILTKSSGKSFDNIDIVAIVDEKDDWYEVVGRNNMNSGWIMKDNVSVNKEDVGMAILARKEIFDPKGNIINDKINDFINNAPYPGSKIVSILRDRLIKSVEQNAVSDPEEMREHNESVPE